MQLIHELLSRYTRLMPPDMVVRKRLVQILSEELRRDVQEKDIRIIGPVAYCSFDSVFKNAVFLKKDVLLQRLEQELGKKILKDIQ
ncbi:MAG: hypothetical protein AMXMBFR44_0030 [Candidatus Campbellbacteria bacterium]